MFYYFNNYYVQTVIEFESDCFCLYQTGCNRADDVDWATAFDKQDNGKVSNLYIKMGYMF